MIKTKDLKKIYTTEEVETTATTIVMVTHSPAYAEYSHRVIHLFDGHIVSENIQKEFNI